MIWLVQSDLSWLDNYYFLLLISVTLFGAKDSTRHLSQGR